MYKLILSDLDETLLVNHHVPEINKQAIEQLPDNVLFVPATGRPYSLIQDILLELGFKDKENTYSMCLNGGCIIDNKTKEKLYYKALEANLVKDIYTYLEPKDGTTFVVHEGCYYMFHSTEYETNRKIIQKADYCLCEPEEFDRLLEGKQCDKIMFSNENLDYLKELGFILQEKYKDKITIAYSSNRYMEINTVGVSKGNALHFLCEYLNIDIKDTIAIGDNYNDVSMIIEAGLGVCVKDGQEEVKQIANYITNKGFDKGAVKEVIDTFIMKED